MIARPSRPYALSRAGLLVFLTGCLAAALVGPLVATSATATYGFAALLVIAGLLAVSARQPAGLVLLIGVVLIAALNDVPQRLHVGPTTGQGVETLALLGIMVLVCLNGYAAGGVPDRARFWPLVLFVAWCVASFTWGGVSQEGIQNVAVYAAFLGMLVISASVGRWRPSESFRAVSIGFRIAAVVGLTLYFLSVVIEGGGNPNGSRLIMSPRPFALFGVILVAWFTAAHLRGERSAKWFIVATLLVTTLSLSRSGLAAQFACIALGYLGSIRDFRTFARTGLVVGAVLVVGLSAVLFYAPLRDRVFKGDVTNVGGVTLNVMGRDRVWSENWGWFQQKPIIGWGAGSADRMTANLPPSIGGAKVGHPHNDYLRILVDFGVIGLAIWVLTYILLIRMMWKRWRERLALNTPAAQVCCAAFLALSGIGLTMLVDNPLIEVVKMAPLGMLVGLAAGMATAEAEEVAALPTTAEPKRGAVMLTR